MSSGIPCKENYKGTGGLAVLQSHLPRGINAAKGECFYTAPMECDYYIQPSQGEDLTKFQN